MVRAGIAKPNMNSRRWALSGDFSQSDNCSWLGEHPCYGISLAAYLAVEMVSSAGSGTPTCDSAGEVWMACSMGC
jgi:hypothetical protein